MSPYTKIAISLGLVFAASSVNALVITQDTDANSLTTALGSTGITITSSTLSGHTSTEAASSGTYTNVSGTYGIGAGIVLSSGNVSDYGDGPNISGSNTTNYFSSATTAQEALLDPITGGLLSHFDVTQLDLSFNAGASTDIFFNAVFGSDEYAEFVGSSFIDAFGIYLNGVNIALFNGDPVNIDHPDMAFLSGTELDGILDPSGDGSNPVMTFQGTVAANSIGNTLTFIIADSGDTVLDSTVYISGLGDTNPGGGNPGGGTGGNGVPEPATLALMSAGLLGFGFARRRMRG